MTKFYYFIISYLIINLFIILLNLHYSFFIFILIIFFTILCIGVFNIQSQFFIQSILKKDTQKKEIALTFDDSPTPYTPLFLDFLKEHQIKASFFCIGSQIEKYPEIFQRIINEGHSIGNHSQNHLNTMGFFSTQQIIEEIKKCDEIIEKVGKINTPFYRPPFGITNPHIAQAINYLEKKSIGWNIRSFDTIIKNEEKILKKILKKIEPGSIILMHDTSKKSLNVLKNLVPLLKNNQYSFFTIDDFKK